VTNLNAMQISGRSLHTCGQRSRFLYLYDRPVLCSG